MSRICPACSKAFDPHRSVPKQKFCSDRNCQRKRKQDWERKKLATDEAYRSNKADSQRSWRARNPDYNREYRRTHPEAVQRNRIKQRERNSRKRKAGTISRDHTLKEGVLIAKTDELKSLLEAGLERFGLVPLSESGIAKSDELLPLQIRVCRSFTSGIDDTG